MPLTVRILRVLEACPQVARLARRAFEPVAELLPPRPVAGRQVNARGTGSLAWVNAHNLRKTTATILDKAGLPARQVADQLGHARISVNQDVYVGRRLASRRAAEALEQALRRPPGRKDG